MGGPEGLTPRIPADLHTWCEVDTAALRHNTAALRRHLSPGALLGVVVKGDAYGHGLEPCAAVFARSGADWLIVNAVDEAERLRRAGLDLPLYLCGPLRPEEAGRVVAAGCRVALYDVGVAQALSAAAAAAGCRVGVHIKVETGTYRQGVAVAEVVGFARFVASLKGVDVEGLGSHFADVEDTEDHAFARHQLESLGEARRRLAEAGMRPRFCHCASSAAALLIPESHQSLVRVGMAAYGLWPSPRTEAFAARRDGDVRLRPALSWRARVAQVKSVPAGASVGYGRSYRVSPAGPQRLAVLPVGYFEGFDRKRSNCGHVLIRGRPAPVRGRVCMNMSMVAVDGIEDSAVGDVATLIGEDDQARITAQQAAQWAGTIHYELVARIHPGVPRLYAESGCRGTAQAGR